MIKCLLRILQHKYIDRRSITVISIDPNVELSYVD